EADRSRLGGHLHDRRRAAAARRGLGPGRDDPLHADVPVADPPRALRRREARADHDDRRVEAHDAPLAEGPSRRPPLPLHGGPSPAPHPAGGGGLPPPPPPARDTSRRPDPP